MKAFGCGSIDVMRIKETLGAAFPPGHLLPDLPPDAVERNLGWLAPNHFDPAKKRYLMLKSRVHWRAGFGDLARATVECAGVGVCTSDYSALRFKRVRRPIYPLDAI